MKKAFIFFVVLIQTANIALAQLKVLSTGKVEVENELKATKLNINNGYTNNIAGTFYGGTSFVNNQNSFNRIINCTAQNTHSSPIGVHVYLSSLNDTANVIGIKSTLAGGKTGIGVFGGLLFPSGKQHASGIYGSTSTYPQYVNGIYAGFFRGDVKSTGTIYGTLVSPSSASSPSGGGTTTNISEQSTTRGESITERLQQVDLLQMERVNQNGSLAANKIEERGTCIDEEGKEVEAEEPIQTKLSPISYGLAADQLQEVFPELVYEDAEGNYSINYVEMVPLLVQSIRELSSEVATLKQKLGISEPVKTVLKTKGKAEDADEVTLTLPDESSQATLNIYDLNGRLLRTASVDATSASLSSHAHGLPAGTYAYQVMVNGKRQKARKMIVK